MVAFDAKEPVAVLIGCKRPPHTLVLRLAVHPDHLRKGHGRHLLTSLSAKLAILGPPRLLAELPADLPPARALFEACGWREEARYLDLVHDAPAASPAPPGVVVPVTVDDLLDACLPDADAPVAWERTRGTLINRKDRLRGLAIPSGERIEASLLYTRDDERGVSIWSLRAAPGADPSAIGVLLRDLAQREGGRLTIPRIGGDEIAPDALIERGFTRGREFVRFGTEALSRAPGGH